LNRDGHPGVPCHFDAETLEPLAIRDRYQAPLLALISEGESISHRGFPEEFLCQKALVSAVTASRIDRLLPLQPEFGIWARQRESEGDVISMLPAMSGPDMVGVQFRAFDRKIGDGPSDGDHIRMYGEADAIYIPASTGVRPSALVCHEGPWGAIAANYDALEYGNSELLSVSTLSANVRPETICTTLDLQFPGVPRFSFFDQDTAGIHARAKAQPVMKPISILGAGSGKDYRDLEPAFRFEQMCEAVRKELKLLEEKPIALTLSEPELDACLCKLPQTEYGLASRFIERYRDRCKYVEAWDRWAIFDGKRWSRTGCGAEAFAQQTIKRLEHEAQYLKDQT
jgi:hypothetical protein